MSLQSNINETIGKNALPSAFLWELVKHPNTYYRIKKYAETRSQYFYVHDVKETDKVRDIEIQLNLFKDILCSNIWMISRQKTSSFFIVVSKEPFIRFMMFLKASQGE